MSGEGLRVAEWNGGARTLAGMSQSHFVWPADRADVAQRAERANSAGRHHDLGSAEYVDDSGSCSRLLSQRTMRATHLVGNCALAATHWCHQRCVEVTMTARATERRAARSGHRTLWGSGTHPCL